MELHQINQRIAVVNGESQRLNSERQQLIGRRQALENQLADLLKAYEKDYGVKLTVETIEAEVARVSALKEKEVSSIEAMLQLIRAGRYDEAEKMAQGAESVGQTEPAGVTEVPAEESVAAQPDVPMQEQQVMQETQEPASGYVFAPVAEAKPVATPQMNPVPPEPVPAPAQEMPPAPPSAPPAVQPPVISAPAAPAPPPVAPKPTASPVFAPSDDAPPAPPPAPPTGATAKPKQPLGTPKLGVPPQVGTGVAQPGGMSFQAILSGQAFNPQQGG